VKFAVGYQPMEEASFFDHVASSIDHIAELYFPWPGMSTGRAAIGSVRGYGYYDIQSILEADLRRFYQAGVSLDLLFNSNCYGEYALSEHLQNQVGSIIEHLCEKVAPIDTVTTTSPAVAFVVKKHFPDIKTRASVNMRIGTVKGMKYLAHMFDEYLVQRDYNRDLEHLAKLKVWADENGKKLQILANSGCMRFCSAQTFHDNLVAHGEAIDEIRRMEDFSAHTCWNYLADPQNWVSILQNTWIRPEDLHHYEHLFPVVKLATRMHPFPSLIIQAYINRSWRHNLLDLMEPGFSGAVYPHIMDNTRFPDGWFEQTSRCNKNCDQCAYCSEVLKQVLTKLEIE
jgi:collagenase-like PrtC family protease